MDPQALLLAIRSHAWPIVAAFVVGFLVRSIKSDAIPIDVAARWRPLLALGLGLASGASESIIGGTPWAEALTGGVGSAFFAMGGHAVFIEALRGGRELGIPKAGAGAAAIIAGVLVVALSGCGMSLLEVAAEVANAGAAAGDAAAPILTEVCVDPMKAALVVQDKAAAIAIDQRCDLPVAAYDLLRSAHVALRAAIVALASGQPPPDVMGLIGQVVEASAKLGQAMAGLR